MGKRLLLAGLLLLGSAPASADCIEAAARSFGVHGDILRAIAIVESRARPAAVNVNANGSVDRGLYQINSVHLAELAAAGIVADDLHDVCLSSHIAALLLKRKVAAFGNTWAAVGAFHSTLPEKRDRYARKVQEVFERVQQLKRTLEAR
ncbi:MAG: lytic transglycosylase domain-containing protein [Burkholderiales bacterium]|nr:lytic transglycosylase domain-containing protein [Burkholderiales bacterium]